MRKLWLPVIVLSVGMGAGNAFGDADPSAGLQQLFRNIAANEAATAENGDEGRGAGVPHEMSVLGQATLFESAEPLGQALSARKGDKTGC